MVKLSPTLLCADLLNLSEQIARLDALDIQWHHVDIMDGHFVPNLAFGTDFAEAICRTAQKPVYLHLMAQRPEAYLDRFAHTGAAVFCFHWEATAYPFRLAEAVMKAGLRCGTALSPATPVATLKPLLPYIEYVTLMAVEPGFSGQKFMPQTLDKIRELRQEAERLSRPLIIEIDGGLDNENGLLCAKAGADVLVGGMFNLFCKETALEENYEKAMKALENP